MREKVVVVGVGEVGGPLLELIKPHHEAYPVDLGLEAPVTECAVMHLCIPFQIPDFEGECVRYIKRYQPALTIINSTISPGTTRRIAEASGSKVAYSPVRGKHVRMQQEMLHYVKFVGAVEQETGTRACEHFAGLGMKTKQLGSPEALELAKLTETTYFGLLIAWAQEIERYCGAVNANYDEVVSFYEEIKFFPPVKYQPGIIGGHCVMPNIQILRNNFESELLAAVEHSNETKKAGETKAVVANASKLQPSS